MFFFSPAQIAFYLIPVSDCQDFHTVLGERLPPISLFVVLGPILALDDWYPNKRDEPNKLIIKLTN